jgi:hypothetical protein
MKIVDLKELGSEAIFDQMRCLKTDDVKAMVAQTIAAFGRLDYRSTMPESRVQLCPTQDCSEENWDKPLV